MSATVKLTSKRQVTFPAEVCEGLGVKPGDEIELLSRIQDGEKCWILKKREAPERPWLGMLKPYADEVENHSMESIRESIQNNQTAE